MSIDMAFRLDAITNQNINNALNFMHHTCQNGLRFTLCQCHIQGGVGPKSACRSSLYWERKTEENNQQPISLQARPKICQTQQNFLDVTIHNYSVFICLFVSFVTVDYIKVLHMMAYIYESCLKAAVKLT